MTRTCSSAVLLLCLATACGGANGPTSPPRTPDPPPSAGALDRAAVVAALDYWRDAAGITYELIETPSLPRLLVRSGTDGLAPQGGGRALIDATDPIDNRARSGLVVFEPGGGQYCRISDAFCRYLYRHELGHALGFIGHSDSGLMNAQPDTLTDRERKMITGLYALPFGARVESSGRWFLVSPATSGTLADLQTASDIIEWNMNAVGGASFRQLGVITRWELPVRVSLQP